MLASAIIYFRETFEIALIVSMLLAATRGIENRSRWIVAGFIAGGVGASVVALFADSISAFAEGSGQEIFNAAVLYVAALFIGWTLLWMHRHAREMKSHFTSVGDSVRTGEAPLHALAIVISLAIWREGSEIVLFSYGMLASGQTVSELASGAMFGIAAGAIVGLLVYSGLSSLSPRHFLRITAILLVLLIAGMASNGTGFLIASGHISVLSDTAWDSSWLIDESGALGQALHALIGYSSYPAKIQVVVYLLVAGGFFVMLRFNGKNIGEGEAAAAQSRNVSRAGCIVIAATVICSPLFSQNAHAGKKIYSPYVEEGEFELEYRTTRTFDDDTDRDGKQKQQFALGYGITDRWFSEIYANVEKSGVTGDGSKFSAIEWANRFQIFEPGERWLDLGIYAAYEIALEERKADKAEIKLLLAKDTGDFSHLANIILEKQVGAYADEGTEAGIAWSSRYRYRPWLEPGIEIHSNFGELSEGKSFDEQSHQAGLVFYGDLPGNIYYDVGYLFGLTDGAVDGELKLIVEYEARF